MNTARRGLVVFLFFVVLLSAPLEYSLVATDALAGDGAGLRWIAP